MIISSADSKKVATEEIINGTIIENNRTMRQILINTAMNLELEDLLFENQLSINILAKAKTNGTIIG